MTQDNYTTPDINLASAMMTKFQYVGVKPDPNNPRMKVFVFAIDVENGKVAANDYRGKRFPVDARGMADNLNALKDEVLGRSR